MPSWNGSWRPAGHAIPTSTTSTAELIGPDEAGDPADGLHPTAVAYRRRGEHFAGHAFTGGGPFH